MSASGMDPNADKGVTKKLLRFGTDHPECVDCHSTDVRSLCAIKRPGKADLILCRNCKARRKPLSDEAAAQKTRRFKDEGYSKPTCVICDDPNLQVLELDHLAHEANSAFVLPLCANDHAIKSFLAESGPMAALRLRDPERSALQLQAAFELGLGLLLGMFAIVDGVREETARCACFGLAASFLFAWAIWNLAADKHFKNVLGSGYDRAIPAEIPR
jgi:hypothetical protein